MSKNTASLELEKQNLFQNFALLSTVPSFVFLHVISEFLLCTSAYISVSLLGFCFVS